MLNFVTCENIYRFDMNQYRIRTFNHLSKPNSVHSSHFYAQSINKINICYFMQPYFNFDMHTNPFVVLMDRHGTCMVNL